MDEKKTQPVNWLQVFAWAIVFLGIAAAIYALDGLVLRGYLSGHWASMTEAQGQVLASIVTVYAAALAGIVGPAILGSKFNNLDNRIEALDDRMGGAADDVESLTKHMRTSLNSVMIYLQRSAGLEVDYSQDDVARASEILEGIRSEAAQVARLALDNSNKWQTTKERFKGMHPDKAPYIQQLLDFGVIDQHDYAAFMRIIESRSLAPEEVTVVVLNDLKTRLTELQNWYGSQDYG